MKLTVSATSRIRNVYPSYRRQAEVYQFLLRQQGLTVSDTAWFVYTNGIKTADRFEDCLSFRTVLLPYRGDAGWVLNTFRAAVTLATSANVPPASPACEWCQFVEQRQTASP